MKITHALLPGAALLGILLAGCGSSPVPAHPAAPATARPAPVSLATRYSTWFSGTGSHVKDALSADLSRLSADLGAYDLAGIQDDGAQLAADASQALRQPMPPVDPADWRTTLDSAATAGNAFARGDITTGGAYCTAATAHLEEFITQAGNAG